MSDISNQPSTAPSWRPSTLLARHPLAVTYGAVAVVALAGWAYLIAMVAAMVPVMDMADLGPGMAFFNEFGPLADLPPEVRASLGALCLPGYATTFGMAGAESWGAGDLALVYLMWIMMVLAMMLPSAAPMLAAYSARLEGRSGGAAALARLSLGYLSVWAGYSALATLVQWGLHEAQLATAMMVPATATLAGTTLVAAGIYQFTPAKKACLTRCRVPVTGLTAHCGTARGDAYRAGIGQGLNCMGCCWALMTVMFAVGVMNVLWIAVLGLVMVVEKTQQWRWLSPAIGVVLIAWGVALLAGTGLLDAVLAQRS